MDLAAERAGLLEALGDRVADDHTAAPSRCAEWAAARPTRPAPAMYTVEPVPTPADTQP